MDLDVGAGGGSTIGDTVVAVGWLLNIVSALRE